MKNKGSLDHEQTLSFIRGFIQGNGEAPTLKEIAKRFDVSESTVHEEIKVLESRGKLIRRPNTSRGISLVEGSLQ
jgi:Mn-dependent DtxR family transcriptional regulator